MPVNGPAGGPRPFAHADAEINIYFNDEGIAPHVVRDVEEALPMLNKFQNRASGPHGQRGNVVSVSTSGNQVTLGDLQNLKKVVESEALLSVAEIEVIW